MPDESLAAQETAFARLLEPGAPARDLDIDAFADGVIAHRLGHEFHTNPYGSNTPSVPRLSWHLGWNQRALRER